MVQNAPTTGGVEGGGATAAAPSAPAPAAPRGGRSDTVDVLILVGCLIAAVAVGAIFVAWARRQFLAGKEGSAGAAVGVMETLRAMHRRGELSDEEMADAKAKLGAGIRRQAGLGGGARPAASLPVTRAGPKSRGG